MGSLQATEIAGMTDRYTGILWHLRSNHYPPVPESMVDPCILAIECINEGRYDATIYLPEGVSWRGEDSAPAYAIAEAHHLDPWIDEGDDGCW